MRELKKGREMRGRGLSDVYIYSLVCTTFTTHRQKNLTENISGTMPCLNTD